MFPHSLASLWFEVSLCRQLQIYFFEGGDGAAEEGAIGTLDIHGALRLNVHLKVPTRLAKTVEHGESVNVLQEDVDWKARLEIMVVATQASHKHM